MRILLCISTIVESSAVPGDFSVAFMSTLLHDAEFIEPPIEAESDSRCVWKLRKAPNGLKKASLLFANYLSDILVDELGFEKCSLVPTAFYHSETDLRKAIHVDDPLTIGEVDTVIRFYDSLKQWLLVRVQDVVGSMKSSICLGCRYWRLGHCNVEAATEHYFEDAFARVGMTNCKSVVTPGVKRAAPAPDSQEARPLSSEEHSTYRQGVGKLQFIIERRPDVLYPLKEAGRQLAYKLFLEMSKEERVAARTGKRTTVTATCDTDWARCAETRRSTTCVCIDWGGFLITCFSRSQTALGLSSPEAEYYGICIAGSELTNVMGVIRFFGFEVDAWILSDSSGVLSLSQRQGVGHQRHIEARYLRIQDHVQRGTFKVGKIPGSLKKADVGTKHVAREDLLRHTRARMANSR